MPASRPMQAIVRQRSLGELADAAGKSRYVGSPEHKVRWWWGGQPFARQLPGGAVGRPGKQTTTVCPLTEPSDRDRATGWVQAAIRNGQCRFHEADGIFPKKVWYEADGCIWMGVLINRGSGEYKGWPIGKEERDEIFGRLGGGSSESGG